MSRSTVAPRRSMFVFIIVVSIVFRLEDPNFERIQLYLQLVPFSLSADESNKDFWTPTLVYYTQYSAETLRPIVSKVASIVLEVPTSNFQVGIISSR